MQVEGTLQIGRPRCLSAVGPVQRLHSGENSLPAPALLPQQGKGLMGRVLSSATPSLVHHLFPPAVCGTGGTGRGDRARAPAWPLVPAPSPGPGPASPRAVANKWLLRPTRLASSAVAPFALALLPIPNLSAPDSEPSTHGGDVPGALLGPVLRPGEPGSRRHCPRVRAHVQRTPESAFNLSLVKLLATVGAGLHYLHLSVEKLDGSRDELTY